jgi:hypothetical protein
MLFAASHHSNSEKRAASPALPDRSRQCPLPLSKHFRTSPGYQHCPAAADFAFCIAAYNSGITEDQIERSLEHNYLSRDPSPSSRAAYMRAES